MAILKKIKSNIWILKSIFKTIYFNFHYLPFKQAIKLPILLCKPELAECKGKIYIECDKIRFGMVKWGVRTQGVYPNNGIIYKNTGGVIWIKGFCQIGNNSSLLIGKNGEVIFGDNFHASASKIISYIGVEFGVCARVGWESIVMDTNFHPLYDIENKKFKKAYGKIIIGDYNWFGSQCVVLHGVTTPERCIFGMRSIVTRGGKYESYAAHGGSPIRVLSRGVMRDYENDQIEEYV